MAAYGETALMWNLLNENTKENGNVIEMQNLFALFLETLPKRRNELTMAGFLKTLARVQVELQGGQKSLYQDEESLLEAFSCAFGNC
jgi:hypothetical protein